MKKTPLVIIPLVLFSLLVVFLFKGLFSDPRALDSQVKGKSLPPFSLPDLMQPEITYEPSDLKGEVTILNVWGVWCVTCAVEMPYSGMNGRLCHWHALNRVKPLFRC